MTELIEQEAVEVPTINAMDTLIVADPEHADLPYFFAAKDGWYQNVPTLFGVAHIPTNKWPPGLPPISPSFIYSDELVPKFIFDQALDFFRKVYNEHKTEATTYICRAADGQYSLFIPTQYVTAASVNHKVDPGEMGERYPVGTIHSHCNFGAFHSGTDEHDMGKMPGLHCTIGMVLHDEPEIAAAIAIGNARFTVDLDDILDPAITADANGYSTAPDHWLNFVKVNETAPWQSKGITTHYGKGKPAGFQHHSGGAWNGKSWDDDDWKSWRDAKREEMDEDLLLDFETDLTQLQIEMAEKGLRLQYTITNEPLVAKAWLDSLNTPKVRQLFTED